MGLSYYSSLLKPAASVCSLACRAVLLLVLAWCAILGPGTVSQMSVVLIQLPKALYEKLGEEATKELVELINTSVKASKENVLEISTDRFERRLRETQAELEKKMAEMETRLTWRMFLFWAGQVGITLGALTLFYQILPK